MYDRLRIGDIERRIGNRSINLKFRVKFINGFVKSRFSYELYASYTTHSLILKTLPVYNQFLGVIFKMASNEVILYQE